MHEILKKVRTERNFTQQDIANALEVDLRVYHRYEKGERELPIRHYVTLAKFYGLSLDYLAGLTDEEKPIGGNT